MLSGESQGLEPKVVVTQMFVVSVLLTFRRWMEFQKMNIAKVAVVVVVFEMCTKDPCPTEKGYKFSSDPRMCYRVGLDKMNHDDAMAACQNDGGFLIRIDSQKKQDYVAQLYQEKVMSTSSQPWIDGADGDVEGEWRFTDETLMTYQHWESSQPNQDGDCLRIQLCNQKVEWWDHNCDERHEYICETPTA
ncbi:lectin BRA-3-like [Gigantopelta aegis]|uniref:lectin BRA-3-like n=1 Tax=Gigantopelta aegis TaxID=1735272 RepID=UPI001B88D5EA|nr:lectin BRA-3-like [Gigantopelta aegis]